MNCIKEEEKTSLKRWHWIFILEYDNFMLILNCNKCLINTTWVLIWSNVYQNSKIHFNLWPKNYHLYPSNIKFILTASNYFFLLIPIESIQTSAPTLVKLFVINYLHKAKSKCNFFVLSLHDLVNGSLASPWNIFNIWLPWEVCLIFLPSFWLHFFRFFWCFLCFIQIHKCEGVVLTLLLFMLQSIPKWYQLIFQF